MFRNHIKLALRSLVRQKGYTVINILGLAVSITCCLLIMLFVRSEFSYDKWHQKGDRIFRLWQQEKYEGREFINTVTPLSAAAVIRNNFPEVESFCRVFAFKPIIKVGENSFTDNVRMVDSNFFQVFDFTLETGSISNPFPTDNSVIITEKTARKYFGKSDPLGKTIQIQMGNELIPFLVAGVAQSPPEESSIRFNLLITHANEKYLFGPGSLRSWFNVNTESYLLLREGTRAVDLENKFPAMIKQYLGEDYHEGSFLFHLQALRDIHLNYRLPAANEPTSNPKYSYILGTIGILILLVACINFITLSIGRSTSRVIEVGIRKVLGAERQQLIRQFWGEAFLLTLFSVLIGITFTSLLISPFNRIIEKELSLKVDGVFLFFSFLLTLVIAMLAGIYPALILSRFNPVEVLKGKLGFKGKSRVRESLIVGQFVASIAMIVCTLAVTKQMNYLRHKDLGYQKEHMIVIATNQPRHTGLPVASRYRAEIMKLPEVDDAAVSVYSLAERTWVEIGFSDNQNKYHSIQYNSVDPYFFKTMGFKMAMGRAFIPDNVGDNRSAAIVNEAFLKEFGIQDPIGKKLPGPFDHQIIGVVRDFHFMSLHSKIRPLLMTVVADSIFRRSSDLSFNEPPQPRISVRLKAGNIAEQIAALKTAWLKFVPGQDFDFRFLEESLANRYKAEQRTSIVVKIASLLSIFIACLGLFGLVTLTVAKRTREIGIRKVLGASVSGIAGMLSKDFLKLILIASIIAFPLGGWFMFDWLKDFEYRTSLSWWIFPLAGFMTMIIALLTVSIQSVRAALTNPAKSLRTE